MKTSITISALLIRTVFIYVIIKIKYVSKRLTISNFSLRFKVSCKVLAKTTKFHFKKLSKVFVNDTFITTPSNFHQFNMNLFKNHCIQF